ncbi:aromatic ring-hydroxylating oxygenase subunit alpha [Pseudomonas sp. NFX98]|uniref:aromatic ring-hydroxylating oxygenase subunit alpha n=1 Tax=Pseudomonas sp. NFX98 TaxID=3399122 RepID=UPI0039FD2721
MSSKEKAKEPSISKWLARDRRIASDAFSRRSDGDFGTADLPIERYTSASFHAREMGAMWSKVWQMACHTSDIPEVGDYITYEIGSRSVVVVHVADGVLKAYPNACLHRGMQLVDGQGRSPAFTCRFHGWSWNLDGSIRRIPERWDFPQTEQRKMCLKSIGLAIWGGFVFINFDPDAQPFDEFIGELPEHFRSAPLEDRRIAVHVARVMPANWKVAMEAFLESYHVSPTHPQSVTVSEYAETQYDVYGDNLSRLATVSVAPATPAMRQMTPQDFADYVSKGTGREPIKLREGETYRSSLAEQRRGEVEKILGKSVDHLTDVEMLDAIEYFLFPNFLPWYGFGLPIVYRFRPNGDRHDSSIMEIYLLAPRDLSIPTPAAAKIEWLPDDRPFAEHPGLGRLGPIFDQDYENIVGVWKGLHSTVEKGLILGKYQESRIRHYHSRIDDFINAEGK